MKEHDVIAGRYRIERKLAAGGFGAIYAATDLVMGREVALKVLHRELAGDALLVARFRREAEALARLRDPHTITMYDAGADADGTPYIVLELLRGNTLHQEFLDHGALPWHRIATIARGVCSSLREAHAAGILHRDLKPANIHLEITALQQDHAKLLDFGIAKLVGGEGTPLPDLTLAGQMVGTFDYMPPEQLIGGTCTGKSDVFALAVVMYEMITGELPFGAAQGPAGRLMTMLTTLPASLGDRADVPAPLADIVARALSRELDDRPELEEIDSVLAQLLDATPIRASQADVATEISALIDQALAADVADNGTFPDDDADTWVGAPPRPTTIGLAPSRFAVGSRTEIPPAKNAAFVPQPSPPTARRVTPAHMPPPPPAYKAAAAIKHARIRPPSGDLSPVSADAKSPTVRAPRRVLTPPNGTMATAASARAEIERLASRPQMPVVRITTPAKPKLYIGRATPSEMALPPAPLVPTGELPTIPLRMATGTSPIVDRSRRVSITKIAIWAVALFGVGFAAALGLGAL